MRCLHSLDHFPCIHFFIHRSIKMLSFVKKSTPLTECSDVNCVKSVYPPSYKLSVLYVQTQKDFNTSFLVKLFRFISNWNGNPLRITPLLVCSRSWTFRCSISIYNYYQGNQSGQHPSRGRFNFSSELYRFGELELFNFLTMKGFLNKVQQKKGAPNATDGKPAGGESNVRVDISLPKTQRR